MEFFEPDWLADWLLLEPDVEDCADGSVVEVDEDEDGVVAWSEVLLPDVELPEFMLPLLLDDGLAEVPLVELDGVVDWSVVLLPEFEDGVAELDGVVF